MKVLVACEFSGIVRDAFTARGHNAWSCDLLPTERPGNHIQGDVLEILGDGWDLMIAHPPCTDLCVSGARWFKNKREKQTAALSFVKAILSAPIPKIALENPVSIISSRIRKPSQIIHPHQFGHPEQKTTCLWLKGLPPLTHWQGRNVKAIMQTLPKSERERILWMGSKKGKERSVTFQGIANAMAAQWG